MNNSEFDKFILRFKGLSVNKKSNMNHADLQSLMTSAVQNAFAYQQKYFEKKIEELTQKVNNVTQTTQIKTFEEIKIIEGVKCEEALDVVRSVPEFEGKPETYVSWRQAAQTAYKMFEKFDGRSKHY